ncbi:hypothetical protein HOLleu_39593 [Holothuria leucospilota]|uniref:Uncharacterized protein n=1 Tax=Holothuria leucospilota TaxID=206669 RepID=A0A9Q0YGP6_HOLLE|nr:hypothetical protein HOLleu_39593 [Holothuria leucospilota]
MGVYLCTLYDVKYAHYFLPTRNYFMDLPGLRVTASKTREGKRGRLTADEALQLLDDSYIDLSHSEEEDSEDEDDFTPNYNDSQDYSSDSNDRTDSSDHEDSEPGPSSSAGREQGGRTNKRLKLRSSFVLRRTKSVS